MAQSDPHEIFATTRWTLVLAAGAPGTPLAEEALQTLCCAYWFPLYAYVRRRGHGREDAEDLTQAFFARLLGGGDLASLSRDRSKFRAFLLAALKHFLANEWDKAQCQKRGGRITHLSLDWQSADTRFQLADSAIPTPDQAFDREWALALLERVLVRLREEAVADGTGGRFEQLKGFLMVGNNEIPYASAAAVLALDEGTVRVAVHRLRKRYRELLRHEVAQTLADPAMVDEELAVLLGAFA